MDVWVPGALSLVGALLGVGLANVLAQRTKKQEARRQRLDDALRAVALAIAGGHFSFRVGVEGVPASVTAADAEELEHRLWLANIERYFTLLRDARESMALLIGDGIDLPDYWRADDTMQAHLEDAFAFLRRLIREAQ